MKTCRRVKPAASEGGALGSTRADTARDSDDGRAAAATLFDRITTPPKVQKLQRTLYHKAKAAPGYWFYSLYGELLRRDVIETAMSAVASNAVSA